MALNSLTAKANVGAGVDALAGVTTPQGFAGAVALVDDTGALINGANPVAVAVGALPLPTGAATEATLATVAGAVKAEDSPHVSGDMGFPFWAVRAGTDAPVLSGSDGDYTPLTVNHEGRLRATVKPATYENTVGDIAAVNGTVVIDCSTFSNIALQVAGTFAAMNCTFEVSNNSTNGVDGNWGIIQAARSNANTAETATGNLSASPAYLWEVSVNPYKWFRVRCTARTSGTQTWTLVPGAYATEVTPVVQTTGTQAISGTVTATVTPPAPATPYFLNSAASTNGALILTGTSSLHSLWATNTGATVAFVKLYNKATAPVVGTDVPEMIIPIPAAVSGVPGVANPETGFIPFRFALGLGIAITGGVADNDTTAVAAGQVKVKLSRST